jgi:hypothetical protein
VVFFITYKDLKGFQKKIKPAKIKILCEKAKWGIFFVYFVGIRIYRI